MYLFFDTETSGMPDRTLPPTHESQPRLVQLGLILADADLRERAEIALLVDPEDTVFDARSKQVHGIEERTARDYGLPLPDVLDLFDRLARRAEIVVAHNIEFDRLVIAIQHAGLGRPNPLEGKAGEDTMLLAQPVCQIESRRGDGFKPPTLAEAYTHFCGQDIANAHDALADCRACLAVYRALKGPKEEQQGTLF